jgi:hypothetical protein
VTSEDEMVQGVGAYHNKMNAKYALDGLLTAERRARSQLAHAEAELKELPAKIAAARAVLAAEQNKLDLSRTPKLLAEYDRLLDELDSEGWVQARANRVFELLAQFRMLKMSGQSAEMAMVFAEKLKNPVTGADRKLRWSTLKGWIKRTEVAA